ncbi:hypothetical protein SAMN05421805_104215 [Saccharopolyspora antimicrobica]|uniref:Uncharacterized protein n=1 Tax=Saccharopolyspora antimicrobica TaxID=455193 RepID=A0A1I4YP14_9PSEU|nr:hypothetical protein [Saccharopolyspora antimicrobica]RKT82744.1 hypothetical protein ATL45_0999 [Saccharopolyspora antimicrobica]SFN39379.1 hypothetical protein SAMN05421805_104215 [Saccharopolyspora antimicrobica]
MAELTDVELLEQDNRAWPALPGSACCGDDWAACPEPGEWQVRGYAGRSFCAQHAAVRLRIADALTERARVGWSA